MPLSTDTTYDSREAVSLLHDQFVLTFRHMMAARVLEDRLAALYRAGGKIVGGVYVGRGQEAYSASLAVQLIKGQDVYSGLIRDQAGKLAFGEPMLDCTRTYLGSAFGPTRGRDGNVHRGRPREGMPAMISHLGSNISVVSGMLMARRLQGRLGDAVGAACMGEGATSTGSFHEALNMAAVEKLPLILAVANNQFAYSTPNSRQFACAHLVDRAIGYGVEGHQVDGTDLDACLTVFQTAVSRARAGHGPQLVIGSLLRLSGHGEHDDASYVPASMKKGPLSVDCLVKAEQAMLERSWMSEEEIAQLRENCVREVDKAFAQTAHEPAPDPFREPWNALSTPWLEESWEAT